MLYKQIIEIQNNIIFLGFLFFLIEADANMIVILKIMNKYNAIQLTPQYQKNINS